MIEKSCANCNSYLGGGCCRLNSEKECAENEFELWSEKIKEEQTCA